LTPHNKAMNVQASIGIYDVNVLTQNSPSRYVQSGAQSELELVGHESGDSTNQGNAPISSIFVSPRRAIRPHSSSEDPICTIVRSPDFNSYPSRSGLSLEFILLKKNRQMSVQKTKYLPALSLHMVGS
jgi:hypothetical protein